jgi:hypothetical protein
LRRIRQLEFRRDLTRYGHFSGGHAYVASSNSAITRAISYEPAISGVDLGA